MTTGVLRHVATSTIGEDWVKSLTSMDVANLNIVKNLPAPLFAFLQNLQSELRLNAVKTGKPSQDWELYRTVAELIFDKPAGVATSGAPVLAPDPRVSELQDRLARLEAIIEDIRIKTDQDWGLY